MESFFNQESSHGIIDDKKALDSVSSSSSSSSSSIESEDLFEEVNSSGSSSSSPTCGSLGPSSFHMSSLLQQLPIKRGLSRHYNGKSQSFTSLSNVRALEDLAKPENPYSKKLKSCKSYGGLFLESCSEDNPQRSNSSSRLFSKKTSSRGSCSSHISGKRVNSGFIGNRPPPIPHRSTSSSSLANQAPLFA